MLEAGLWRERSAVAAATPAVASSAAAPSAATAEPVAALEWRPVQTVRQRLLRAVSVPALAGATVFVAAVIIAIVMTVTQSHEAAEAGTGRGTGTASEESALAPAASGEEADATSGSADRSAGGGEARPEGRVFVHVVGEVTSPGVVELEAGTRVSAAIEAAGGAKESAVLSAVNLARTVVDGEQIVIPNAESAASATQPGAGANGTGAAESSAGAGGAGGGAGDSASATGPGANALAQAPGHTGLVNLNSADGAALETLPRVGPALAQAILEWRQLNGAFTSVEQLLEVSGIGAKTLEGLRELVTV